MGLTGLEPVTLRLSSACSNQLSYRPGVAASPRNFRISIVDFRFVFTGALRAQLLKSAIANRKSKIKIRCPPSPRLRRDSPDTLSALEARGFEPLTSSLQSWRSTNSSFAPDKWIAEFRLPIFDCKEEKTMPDVDPTNRHPACRVSSNGRSCVRVSRMGALFSCPNRHRQIRRSDTRIDRSLYP